MTIVPAACVIPEPTSRGLSETLGPKPLTVVEPVWSAILSPQIVLDLLVPIVADVSHAPMF